VVSRSGAYDRAVAALEAALQFGIRPSLDGIRGLVDALGHPERAFTSVQVTGTNGKTSVTRLIAALLEAHGHRTGCYTSPHLVEYVERIGIAGSPIARDDFVAAVKAVLDAVPATGVTQDLYTELRTHHSRSA